MQKTKLGMSIGLLSAVIYFTALFGGYIPLFMIAGYVLIFEQNDWLKRVCFKAVILLIAFSMITAIVGILPNLMNSFSNFIQIFNGDFSYIFISRIVNIFNDIMNIIKVILFIMLGFKAYKIQDIRISNIDKIIDNM
ncbi:MAG: hypothetical protein II193_04385 [Lachnospiraceae bacterium]|nr:hypothetical protein [Lachnospiraceae bacterium]